MKPGFQVMGFQLDVGRQIERPEVLSSMVLDTHKVGYNACMLYLEDAYAFPRHPRIGRKHAYSVEVMQQLHRLCASQGQEVIPVIPSLGHAGYITGKEGYAHYDEGRGTGQLTGCLSPSFPETYTLLRELYEDWCHHIPGRYLHVGLDESGAMGQHHIRTCGAESLDAAGMFAGHCNRLNEIVRSLGRRMVMWGDMFYYLPQAMAAIDKDVIVADWYYYPFEDTPAVEAFGFRKLDSSRILRRAGFEVWGIPSIWPNCPFPNIRDRWRNLRDWMRYGQAAGVSGIINAEWENSWGLPGTTELLFRMFGRMCAGESGPQTPSIAFGDPVSDDLEEALAAVLASLSGHPSAASAAKDALNLGEYHITAQCNRKAVHQKPEAMISTHPQRRSEFRRNSRDLEGMFKGFDAIVRESRDESARRVLEAVRLSHQALRLFWKSHSVLTEAYAQCVGDPAEGGVSVESLPRLAGELESFAADFCLHWDQVRFADEQKAFVGWARRTAAALREWAPRLGTTAADEHPLLATPRLETILHCRHPALPIVSVTVRWKDGTVQEASDVMIPFEPSFTVPEREWTQCSVHVLDRREIPRRVEFAVRHYGQVGVGEAALLWRGKSCAFRAAGTEGTHVEVSNGVVWLGPASAAPGDPLIRPDVDRVWFEPKV